jgi:preprotein translocase subunit YajC
MNMLNAIQPGNKVKTIGGICGVVVEICPEDNTFILETGSEASGKSYIKFDKQAVYQTDAVAKKEEIAPVEETVSPVPAEEVFEEVSNAPVEEAEVTEEAVEKTEE